MQHATVTKNLIINGNGAYISNAKENNEHDMGFDTYAPLTKEISVKVYSLDGIAAWGERKTDYTLNLYFENCKNMNRVYLSSETGIGTNNITLKDCSFNSSKGSHQNTSVYSNSKGNITIENCTFEGIGCPINLNNKSNGAQTVSVNASTFKDCSTSALQTAEDGSTYFAPIRLVVSKSGSTSATINTCQITGNESSHGDILLGDGREGKASSDKLSATVINTAATIKIEDPEKETRTLTAKADETITANAAVEAEMGDKLYKNFSDAVAAAKDGDTIKLLKDADCEGIQLQKNAYNTNGLTLDLDGHTLTIVNPTTGSAGTKTNGLQLQEGNKITLKNGIITSTVAKHLIQNYADLRLENIKLDGSKLVYDGKQATYTLSHNCGTLYIDKDSEIIAEEHGFAFDISEWGGYMGATATVESGATINGKIELKNYTAGATFTGKLIDGSGNEYTEQGNYVQNGSAFKKVGSLSEILVIYNMKKTERENGGESGNYYPVHIYAAVDELSYREVGFYVTAKNTATNQEKAIKKSIKTVYTQMNVTDHNGNKTEYGEDEFGAKYIFGHELLFDASAWSNENTEIKVKPYAIKLDGGEITGDTIMITDAIIKAQNSTSALFNTEEY